MTPVHLSTGTAPLSDWRRIWRGDAVRLDGHARSRIAAGAGALQRILARDEAVYGLNTGFGKLASVRIPPGDLAALQRNLVLSHAAGVGPPTPPVVVRLTMALKLASLAKGASGVRKEVTDLLQAMLERDLLPVIPEQGSVGASGDLAPLAHLACALIGEGEIEAGGERSPAAQALAAARLAPLTLGPKEGLALLNGTQFSTAWALAGLFRAHELWRAALVVGALSTEAAKGADTPFDPRIHALRGHPGQIEAAAALRALMAGSAIRESHRKGDVRVQDPYSLRCQPQVMGAVLSLLRYAAGMLETEASGVTDNPLILADDDEALSGGNFHAEGVGFAADALAMALCEIGSLAERRVAVLIDPALSGLPAFLSPTPGLHSGFMIAQVTAAALVAENRSQAFPASVDSIPTSAGQEDHVAMSAHAARRLARLAGNLESILAIELLAAAQGCDFHAPLTSSPALERVRALVRGKIPTLAADRALAPDIAAAASMIATGAVSLAAGLDLPGLG